MLTLPEKYRITRDNCYHHTLDLRGHVTDPGLDYGHFWIPKFGKTSGQFFFVKASQGAGWEHVSVSIPTEKRSPTWDEMCHIKDVFWPKEDAVIQIHPSIKDYVNNHKFCLHLWRFKKGEMPLPPPLLVGLVD